MIVDQFHDCVEYYRRGLFDFISFYDHTQDVDFSFHSKQIQALELMNDNITTYVGYGGAARGGKTALETLCPLFECFVYPGARYLIGRKDLTILHRTTWKTLDKFMKVFGFEENVDYKHNKQKHELTFENGSEIIFQNLELQPSDQEATSYGSLEITKAFIDQSEQVSVKIVEKVGERVGSHVGHKYGIKGKVMEAFNPSNTHVKSRYWIPFRNNQEKETRRFVRALPTDNPSPEAKQWVEQKKKDFEDGTMSLVEYQKQILGNFDFDNDPNDLVQFDEIKDLWTNAHVQHGGSYLIADVAGRGKDDYVLTAWSGLRLTAYETYKKNDGKEAKELLNDFALAHRIPNRNICFDAVGLGFALSGYFDGATEFNSGRKPYNDDYYHLRDECAYMLAKMIKQSEIFIDCDMPHDLIDKIQIELGQLKSYHNEKDGKLRILPKDKIVKNIGHSPNWMDVFIMRMVFLVVPTYDMDITGYGFSEATDLGLI